MHMGTSDIMWDGGAGALRGSTWSGHCRSASAIGDHEGLSGVWRGFCARDPLKLHTAWDHESGPLGPGIRIMGGHAKGNRKSSQVTPERGNPSKTELRAPSQEIVKLRSNSLDLGPDMEQILGKLLDVPGCMAWLRGT